MTGTALMATLGLGFLLGLRHATEADHVVAVATIVSERRSVWSSALVGLYWGLGHTAALAAAMLVVLALGVSIPDPVAGALELAVAVMIVTLGLRLLWTSTRDASPAGATGRHSATAPTQRIGTKPLLIGVVHGLAGSAALTVLVQAQIASHGGVWPGLAYLATFGAGSIAGMGLMGSVIGLPFLLQPAKAGRLVHVLPWLAGLASTAFGLWYGWQAWQGG